MIPNRRIRYLRDARTVPIGVGLVAWLAFVLLLDVASISAHTPRTDFLFWFALVMGALIVAIGVCVITVMTARRQKP